MVTAVPARGIKQTHVDHHPYIDHPTARILICGKLKVVYHVAGIPPKQGAHQNAQETARLLVIFVVRITLIFLVRNPNFLLAVGDYVVLENTGWVLRRNL
ncbi:MAG: hypothetical protein WD492_03115 [Alkalispirochaeta sp.]